MYAIRECAGEIEKRVLCVYRCFAEMRPREAFPDYGKHDGYSGNGD